MLHKSRDTDKPNFCSNFNHRPSSKLNINLTIILNITQIKTMFIKLEAEPDNPNCTRLYPNTKQ